MSNYNFKMNKLVLAASAALGPVLIPGSGPVDAALGALGAEMGQQVWALRMNPNQNQPNTTRTSTWEEDKKGILEWLNSNGPAGDFVVCLGELFSILDQMAEPSVKITNHYNNWFKPQEPLTSPYHKGLTELEGLYKKIPALKKTNLTNEEDDNQRSIHQQDLNNVAEMMKELGEFRENKVDTDFNFTEILERVEKGLTSAKDLVKFSEYEKQVTEILDMWRGTDNRPESPPRSWILAREVGNLKAVYDETSGEFRLVEIHHQKRYNKKRYNN